MRKILPILLAAALLLALAGCDMAALNGKAPTTAPQTAEPVTAAPTPTPEPTAEPTPEPTPTPTPEPTPPGVLPMDVYSRFGAVGFSGLKDGSPAIAKWTSQIKIEVAGKPGEADRKALSALISKLKGTAGIPEILLVTTGGNFVIGFLPESKGDTVVPGYSGSGAQGFAELGGSAPRAGVMIPDGLADQAARDGGLAHWMMLGLGLAAGAEGSQAGSVLDQNSAAAAPTESDWLMLALLYGEGVQPGMVVAEAMPAVYAYDPAKAIAPDSANSPSIGRQAQLEYFNEVGFYWGGSASGIVSKWAAPVKLQVSGDPTAEQRELLDVYLAKIAAIPGFPGFVRVESGAALLISFQPIAGLKREYPTMAAGESGYFTINRAKGGKIAKCVIGTATDFTDGSAARTQFLRLLMRALGFDHTSASYPDSVFNYAAPVQDWAALDWMMVEFLYRSDVKVGEKRMAVINKLKK